ncbi:MAG: hypothetical protein P4L84_18430 [Isosphaeraceae bacterium]|nr:hypothetical protein [Isosphaeraceae bacterium]
MIRIAKPAQSPKILRTRGVAKRVEHCHAYDAAPDDHHTGVRSIEIDTAIYNAKSVKAALLKAQHQKCCYCEAKLGHVAFGDVEHFRPKAGYQQQRGDPLGKPGYYWLAYEWANLFVSCQICNQEFKKNLFPLEEPARRAHSHHDNIANESPLLIDPAARDPEHFIGFREEYPVPVDGNATGKTTINVLKLDERPALIEARRELLCWIKLVLQNRQLLDDAIANAGRAPQLAEQLQAIDAQFAECIRDSSEFAAMARAALNSVVYPPLRP